VSVEIDIIRDSAAFSSLSEEWNALASRFNSPLLRHEWFAACADAFCPPGELSIMVAHDGGEPTAIAPLVINPKFGTRRFEILGTSVLGELSGFIYRDEGSLRRLIKSIVAARRPVLFRCLLSDSPELQILRDEGSTGKAYAKSVTFSSPWIPITSCWDEFYSTISSSWRSTLRRAQRRAEEIGKVEYEICTPTAETLDGSLEEMVRVESSGWKSRTGTAVLVNTGLNRFFRNYTQSATRLGILRFAFLRIDGKSVASQLLVDYGRRYWVLKVGYDESYARCSPGILLMHHVIHNAFEQRREAFELLGANEPWVHIWKPQVHNHELYRRYPLSPLSVISHGLEAADSAIGRVRAIMKKEGGGIPWRVLVNKIGRRFGIGRAPVL